MECWRFWARSTEQLHLLSSHSVDHICIQESNLSSSSSFRIPGFSALRSDWTHSRSGILSPDATHASGGVIIFVKQGLSFSELSTPLYSSLSSLDPYSDFVGVNISLNNSFTLSFLNVYAPLFALFQRMAELTPFLHSFLFKKSLHSSEGLQLPSSSLGLERYLRLFPLNDPDTPTLLHRSTGSRSSPDISFAFSSLGRSCFGRYFRTCVLTT